MGGGSSVGEDAIAAFGNAPLSGDMPEGADQGADLGGRGIRGKIIEGDVFSFRDHQDMCRRSRGDVVKGEDVLVLIDYLAWDLAAQDAGEDVIAVVGHQFASAG